MSKKQPSLAEVEYGEWTPEVTGITNVATVGSSICHFTRIGDIVHCSGYIIVAPTASGGTSTKVAISLPIPSNFTSTANANGIAVYSTGLQTHGHILGNITDDRVELSFYANYTSDLYLRFDFTYKIIE